MQAHEIVPDIIEKSPTENLTVQYKDLKVDLGNELTPLQVKDEPQVTFNAEADAYYTLIMADPDAPSRIDHKFRSVLHWLVVNIPGSNLSKGDHIAAYVGSGPPKGSGLHRYVFLVYKQTGIQEFDQPRTPSTSRAHRLGFNVKEFVNKNNLGDPIFGNFYQAQWDEYVEERNKHITN